MMRLALPLLMLSATLPLPSAHASEFVDGTFAFMTAEMCYETPATSGCYKNDPVQARKAVNALADLGVTRFLLPPTDTLAIARLIGGPIKDRGLTFYTYEGFDWYSTRGPHGAKDCASYTTRRVDPLIAPLRAEFGDTYAGLHFADEPAIADIARLEQQTNCVKSDARLNGMKIFVNLLPLHANEGSYNGTEHAGALTPSQYGVDCSTGSIAQPSLTAAMVNKYSNYARDAVDKVRPDYLAFNLYPFVPSLHNCVTARDLLLSENMSIISNLARSRGRTSIAYLQNVRTADPANHPDPFNYANFNDLRWFASWFYTFGGNGLANFASHTHRYSGGLNGGGFQIGLLDWNNEPTNIAGDELNLHSYGRQFQRELSNHAYRGFVDNALGVTSGDLVGWISSNQVLAGEYGAASDTRALVVFSRRSPASAGSATVGLNRWWTQVEKLDLWTGQWTTVGTSTNSIDVSLSTEPGALYRLSM
ncbi:hypothetical protein [Lysobacter sp. 1R34A]|uniref:hypothetical protein n=1 Tax=Lysobacter sp. 1R34A TaxID=3445786 RepID=UPI003EECD79A